MQIGKVSVPGHRGMVPRSMMSQQDRDKLRERRNLALQKMKTLGLTKLVLSTITTAVGIAMLVVSGRGSTGWPVFNFGPAIVGIIMFIAGLLAFLAGKKGDDCQRLEETPTAIKGLFIGYYVICVTCVSLCGVSLAFSFAAAVICSGGESRYYIYCFPDKETNVTLAAIGGTLCAILAVFCIVACVFFCMYARSFGFKNRYERAMEYQMGMMMRMMQENQQGQFQGQAYAGQQGHPVQDYWGESGMQQGQFSNQYYRK